MKAPEFWLTDGPLARLLEPLGAVVAAAGAVRRWTSRPWQAPVPVFCIGNITVGGTGKTPVALWLGQYLLAQGMSPAYLSRGYGGTLKGPLQVDPTEHTSLHVGDEPLMLAGVAPTWIGSDRVASAKAAIAAGADCLILDDGFQNPSLMKTASFVVVDGAVGFGNGKVMPAGPCREIVRYGLQRANAMILIGEDAQHLARKYADVLPVYRACMKPRGDFARLNGAKVVAFAGIGRPGKFFRTVEDVGARIVHRMAFADHHPYTEADIQPILDEAYRLKAIPLTTEKDAMRLPPDQRQQVDVLGIELDWGDGQGLAPYIQDCLRAHSNARVSS